MNTVPAAHTPVCIAESNRRRNPSSNQAANATSAATVIAPLAGHDCRAPVIDSAAKAWPNPSRNGPALRIARPQSLSQIGRQLECRKESTDGFREPAKGSENCEWQFLEYPMGSVSRICS